MNRPDRAALHLPLGLLGSLVIIGLVEGTLEGKSFWLHTPDQTIANRTVKHLPEWSRNRQFLVFGDSQSKQSIAPRELKSLTNQSGYNLALAGSQAANSYFLLRRAIDASARPELVMVDFFPPLQRISHWHFAENDPFLLSTVEALDLAIHARDPGFFASMIARKVVPSFRLRQAIRTLALRAIKGEPDANWAWSAHVLTRNHLANDGAQVHPAAPITPERIAQLNADLFPRWETLELHERYIERFLRFAESRGVRVAWLLTPFHPELQRLTEQSGFDAAWTAYVESWQRRHPSLVVVDGRRLHYPETAFLDPNHLAQPGIALFNQALASQWPALTNSSARQQQRWLHLTPAPTLAASQTAQLEDIPTTARFLHARNQSRMAQGTSTRIRK